MVASVQSAAGAGGAPAAALLPAAAAAAGRTLAGGGHAVASGNKAEARRAARKQREAVWEAFNATRPDDKCVMVTPHATLPFVGRGSEVLCFWPRHCGHRMTGKAFCLLLRPLTHGLAMRLSENQASTWWAVHFHTNSQSMSPTFIKDRFLV
jgi:hypothetical protein